jgi:hypothetical protein
MLLAFAAQHGHSIQFTIHFWDIIADVIGRYVVYGICVGSFSELGLVVCVFCVGSYIELGLVVWAIN